MIMPATNRYRRLWFYGSNTILTSLIFVAILVMVVMIVEKHPWRLDLTETGKYTLAQQTRKILDSIQEPVTIKAFFRTTEQEGNPTRDLLDTLCYYSKNVSYEFIDPDLHPELARKYEIRDYGTLVLEGFNKKQSLQKADEESVVNALFKLTQKKEKKIYFLLGHGEHSLDYADKDGYSTLRASLEKENYTIEDLNLLQQDRVPEDAALLIVAGPKKPLLEHEIACLKRYLQNHGKLLLMLDPYQDAGLKDLVQGYGMQLNDDVIIDKLSRVFGGSYLMPVVTQYGLHKVTEGFNFATFYPEARSVRTDKKAPAGVRVVILASTSEEAWSEMDQETLKQGQVGFDEKSDLPGPVPIVVLAEIGKVDAAKEEAEPGAAPEQEQSNGGDQDQAPSGKAYLLVCGNSSFVDNANFGVSGNGDFFLNIANFLAEEESLITIERREKKGQPLVLTRGQERLVFWVSLLLMPCVILVVGTVVYRVRRSQR
jgi:ABC-type uncharacterized transport system involved in gliding motility auxiliary subunit